MRRCVPDKLVTTRAATRLTGLSTECVESVFETAGSNSVSVGKDRMPRYRGRHVFTPQERPWRREYPQYQSRRNHSRYVPVTSPGRKDARC